MFYDGFKSHVNVAEGLELFTQNKFRCLKEESANSHVNQAYDQQVALMDKKIQRRILDMVRPKLKNKITQWQVIGCLSVSLAQADEGVWEDAFKSVNLHPHHRVEFNEWLKQISDHIETGEQYFKRGETTEVSLCDAMPAVWKNMPVECRQSLVQCINSFYKNALPGVSVWTKENLLTLCCFVSLKQIPHVCASYMAYLKDPAVVFAEVTEAARIVESDKEIWDGDDGECDDDEGDDDNDASIDTAEDVDDTREGGGGGAAQNFKTLHSFMLKPPTLISNFPDTQTKTKDADQHREKLFRHMANMAVRSEWKTKRRKVSDWLNCEVTEDNYNLLNPRPVDIITGFIMQDIKGEGVKKKLAARRLNNIDACVSSYACVLNSDERMKQVREANSIAMVMADIQRDKDEEKKRKKQDKQKEDAEKAKKKAEDAEKAAEKAAEGMIECAKFIADIDAKGKEHIKTFNNEILKLLLRYYYNDDVYKKKGTKKADWQAAVITHYGHQHEQQQEILHNDPV